MDWRESYLEKKYAIKGSGEQKSPREKSRVEARAEVEQMIDSGQYSLAARTAFEDGLASFARKFNKSIRGSDTYREIIAGCLSSFTPLPQSFLTADTESALAFVNLLVWNSGPGKEEFTFLISLSKLYFEFYEPLVFGSAADADVSRMKHLARDLLDPTEGGG